MRTELSSVSKTLKLLAYFTPARPEIGLSQLCRLAARDKATTYRGLQSLEQAGFVEQNRETRQYRLGPALLQFAQIREITVPRKAGATGPLHDLADAIGETAHVTVLSGTTLRKLMAVESTRHSTRVILDIQTFPLHATASGMCALAFGPEDLFDLVKTDLTSFTSNTVVCADALYAAIEATRTSGFGQANGSFEADVYSLSAPLFDQTGSFSGAVSVASVASRFTPEMEQIIKTHLITVSRDITHNWGGTVPTNVEQAWSNSQ